MEGSAGTGMLPCTKGEATSWREFCSGLFAALGLRLLTETAASGDSYSQDHAMEALQGFYLPEAMRESVPAVPLRTTDENQVWPAGVFDGICDRFRG